MPLSRALPEKPYERVIRETTFFGSVDLKRVNPNKHIKGIVVLWVPDRKRIVIGVTNETDDTSEIYISDDYGKNWVLKYTDAYAGNRYRCGFISRKGTIFMGGETYSARSTDNGETWERMTDPNIAAFCVMNFTEDKEGNVYACEHWTRILKSADEGVTWTEVYDVTAEDDHLHGCQYDRYRDKFWIATGDTNYKLIRLSKTFAKEAEWTITVNDAKISYFAPIVTEEALFWPTDAGGKAYITKAKTDMSKWYHIVIPTHAHFADTNNIWYRGIFGEYLTFWGRDYQYFLFTNDMGETIRRFSVGGSKTVRWACDAGTHVLIICEDVLVSVSKETQVVDWPKAKGMDFVVVGLYASTYKQLVALLLIA